jgi:hypothetical protein
LQMVEFLGQTTSLQEIHLGVSRRFLSDESRLIVLEALARNIHISDLVLGFDMDDGIEMFADSVQMLHQSTTLQLLHLRFWGDIPLVPGHVWTSLLKSGIPPRCCLSLFCMPFDRKAMKGLVKGLIERDAAIDLRLDACDFYNGAAGELLRSIPNMRKHMVSTLTITQMDNYENNDFPRMNDLLKDLVAKIYPVSPFQHLVIDMYGDFTLFLLRQLKIKAPPYMESLALECHHVIHGAQEMKALAAFVKSAVHLKKLSLDLSSQRAKGRAALKEALPINGSIVDVGEGLTRKYCNRNANLRLLLQEPIAAANLSLVPSLFQAAKAAKKMAATMILAGLLGLND